jgi:hypothetical protein
MRPTHIMESNLLYSKSITLHGNPTQKLPKTSRIIFDYIRTCKPPGMLAAAPPSLRGWAEEA